MGMETKDLSEIHFADYNPRIALAQFDSSLDASLTAFGDISGITNNLQTNTLVTGHQRLRILEKRYPNRVKIYIEHRFDQPDEYGTVATGFVAVEGTNLHLSYRDVQWDQGKEKAANIAANKIEAQFDNDLLAKLDYDLSQLENGDELLALTGQMDDEVTKLLQSVGAAPDPEEPEDEPGEPKDDGKVTFALSPDQKEVVDRALAQAKADYAIPHTNLDNINGTALYYICSEYLQTHTSQNIENVTPAEPSLPTAGAAQGDALDQIPADPAASAA